jgi:chemotaxis protein methyltransferase CheR
MTVTPAAGGSGTAASGLPPIGPQEFRLFQRLIHEQAGIFLSEAKRTLLVGRLSRRLRELGLKSFSEYYRHVTERDPSERLRMIDCICTNETRFFREPQQFEFLEDRVFPQWRAGSRGRRIRVWSAACSTGEEPYSLAMTLLSHFPRGSGWEVEILASDLSTRVLARAREGVWPLERASEIPQEFLKRFMLRGTGAQEGRMRAGNELRSVIRFERINLNEARYPVPGGLDLVFCRNVLIYFDPESKLKVVRRLLGHMAPGGHLFLGHAESLLGMNSEVRRVGPTVYTAGEPTAP